MAINRTKVQNRAEKLIGQGKIAQGIEQYTILLKDQPNDLATLNRVGDLLARNGKAGEATHLFVRAAHLYTTGGFFLKAIAIYKKILKLDPRAVEARLRLADLYARGDFTSEARIEYEAVIEGLLQQGFDAKAREVHEKLIRMDPGSVRYRAHLGDAYLARGDVARGTTELLAAASELERVGMMEGSLEIHRQILGLEATEAPAMLGSIRAVLRLGAFETAIPPAEVFWRKAPEDRVRAEVFIEALELAGRTTDAESIARTALHEAAEGALSRMVLGRLHASSGRILQAVPMLLSAARDLARENRHAEAARALDVLLEHEPDNLLALEHRIEVARMLGNEAHAKELSDRHAAANGGSSTDPVEEEEPPSSEGEVEAPVADLTPEDREFLNEHLTEAEVFFKYGLMQKALGPLVEIIARFPDHLESRQRLKTIYADEGKRSLAIEQCLAIAELHRKAGNRDDAVSAAMEARILDPDYPGVAESLEKLGVRLVASPGGEPARGETAATGRSAAPVEVSTAAREDGEVGSEFFNLEGEFGNTLADVLASDAPATAPAREEESIEEVFKAFQQKVDEVVDSEDFKTHYELAIAYKEMGLVDEAVSEFEYTAKDPERLVDCCTLIGMCLRERGTPEQAESWYRKALDASPTNPGQALGLRYELGETYLEMGQTEKAYEMFRKVAEVDRNYRNVGSRLEEVGSAAQ